MKLLLMVISLLAIAIVPLPAASAGGAYAYAASYGYGNCDTSTSAYHTNQAGASGSVGGVGSVYAFGGTWCGAYQDWWTGQIYRWSETGAIAQACTAATGCRYVLVDWYSFGTYCQTWVIVQGVTTQTLGCPAGTPQRVPALIP